MSRATACFSMYSDMAMRTMACSSSKRNSASARAVSVFATTVAAPSGLLRFDLRLLDLLLHRCDGAECLLLALPLCLHPGRALAQLRQLALDALAAVDRGLVLLLEQRGALDLELHDATLHLVD